MSSSVFKANPEKISETHFDISKKGYDPQQVHAFTEEMSSLLKDAQQQINQLNLELQQAQTNIEDSQYIDPEVLTEHLGAAAARLLNAARREAEAAEKEAQNESQEMLQGARREASEIRSKAEEAFNERIEAAKAEAKRINEEAIIARRKTLTEMGLKRKEISAQIARLRAGRDLLLDSIENVGSQVGAVKEDLSNSLADAKIAADRAARKVMEDPEPSVEYMEAELATAKLLQPQTSEPEADEDEGLDYLTNSDGQEISSPEPAEAQNIEIEIIDIDAPPMEEAASKSESAPNNLEENKDLDTVVIIEDSYLSNDQNDEDIDAVPDTRQSESDSLEPPAHLGRAAKRQWKRKEKKNQKRVTQLYSPDPHTLAENNVEGVISIELEPTKIEKPDLGSLKDIKPTKLPEKASLPVQKTKSPEIKELNTESLFEHLKKEASGADSSSIEDKVSKSGEAEKIIQAKTKKTEPQETQKIEEPEQLEDDQTPEPEENDSSLEEPAVASDTEVITETESEAEPEPEEPNQPIQDTEIESEPSESKEQFNPETEPADEAPVEKTNQAQYLELSNFIASRLKEALAEDQNLVLESLRQARTKTLSPQNLPETQERINIYTKALGLDSQNIEIPENLLLSHWVEPLQQKIEDCFTEDSLSTQKEIRNTYRAFKQLESEKLSQAIASKILDLSPTAS